MVIGLDWDNTFTACPVLWTDFIESAKKYGHTVLIVTARRDTPENRADLQWHIDHWELGCPVIFCNLRTKIDVVKEKGHHIDVWIDDNPRSIIEGL